MEAGGDRKTAAGFVARAATGGLAVKAAPGVAVAAEGEVEGCFEVSGATFFSQRVGFWFSGGLF